MRTVRDSADGDQPPAGSADSTTTPPSVESEPSALRLPQWPPAGLSDRAEQQERFRSARVDGDGVLFGQWCGSLHVMCFVSGQALALVAERELAPSEWLETYRKHVRFVQAVVRDLVQYLRPVPGLIVLTESHIEDARRALRASRGNKWAPHRARR